MRRKRKRKVSLRPKPFLVLGLVIVVGVGVVYSPITSIRKVRIEGAIPSDRGRLERIAKKLEDIPNIQIDPRIYEAQVLDLSEAQNAELTRGLFGSALLRVRYRTPVARMYGNPNILLSNEGVIYKAAVVPDGLPIIQLPANGPPTVLTLAGSWQPQRMANLAQESLKLKVSGVVRIEMDDGGVVCLNMDSGRVILGSLNDLDKKLSVLRARLAANPEELSQVEALNLTSPDSPSFVPRKGDTRS